MRIYAGPGGQTMTILRNLFYGTAVVVLVLIGTTLGMKMEDE